jgi:hypothetical protein
MWKNLFCFYNSKIQLQQVYLQFNLAAEKLFIHQKKESCGVNNGIFAIPFFKFVN